MRLPLDLHLQPSRRLAALLIAAHGGVAASLAALVAVNPRIPLWLIVVLLSAVAASLVWQLVRMFGARRIVRLALHKDGALDYRRQDGETASVRVDPQSMVAPWLTVLLLRRTQGRRLALTLLPDALDEEDFRRLRLWLRWLAAGEGVGGTR